MIAIVVIEMFEVVEEFKVPPWGFGVGMLPWMRGSRKMIQIISDAQSITYKLEKIKTPKTSKNKVRFLFKIYVTFKYSLVSYNEYPEIYYTQEIQWN